MKEFIKSAGLLLGCIALARFIGLPANVTPFIAMAVFMPYMTSNRLLQLALPTTLLFTTDLVIGLYGPLMLFVYGTMLLTGLLSRLLHKDNIQTLLGTSVLSVVLWHFIVNGAVVFFGNGFGPLTPEALLFDIRLLVSTLVFSSIFYGVRSLFTQEQAEIIQLREYKHGRL
tara:strand:- start:6030 stop:6542 length:513 start_codon:yes stop_codon:yes gene_type:complete